jgi:hypothetical protein
MPSCHIGSMGKTKPVTSMIVLDLEDEAAALRVAHELAVRFERTVVVKNEDGVELATFVEPARKRVN